MTKEEQIKQLEKEIHKHNKKYFIENDPEISDGEFDELTKQLEKLNPNSPVLYELVGEIGNVTHPKPMLSLEKKFTHDDIKKWVTDISDKIYLVEPKYDGMAARYQNGTLSTRGNGIVGEDISERLPYLNVIGKLLKDNSSTYGEIVIPLDYFNNNLSKEYKNPRNAVVGIVKAKTIKPEGIKAIKDKGIHFVLHDQVDVIKATPEQLLDKDQWEAILEETFRSEYPLDGIVIKATDEKLRARLGSTQHHPKWEVAYKTPAERKFSKVVDIKDQVGRTGRITSVAVIKPITLSGATVTNVTLHNFDFLKSSKIGIGSKVEVMRSGEVIPFIIKVIPAKSPHNPRTKCPACGKKLVESGKYLECINPACPARISQSIEYFFKTLGVEELGLKTVEKLINILDLKDIVDFYNIKPEDISVLDGFAEKSAKNITDNIKSTLNKKITPTLLLQALGLKEIGPASSRWIIDKYGFDKLNKLRKKDLEDVNGIGPIKAEYFVKNIKDRWPIVKKLQRRGLKFKPDKSSDKLNGLSFCITGSLENHSRDELIELITQNGGEYKSSVTKNLDYLIAGENGGSKLEKARSLGIEIISENELLEKI